MLDYTLLTAFAAVIRHGSFDAAASALGLTQSAISQRIKLLEERFGSTLIIRGQPAQPTSSGKTLLRHVQEVQMLERALTDDLGIATDAPTTLRIAVNADSLASWFLVALADFTQDHPNIYFDLITDDQDHSAEWLKSGEVVAAVTAIARPISGCDCTSLGNFRYIATASPAFVSRYFPNGVTIAALSQAPALQYDTKDQLQNQWAQRESGASLKAQHHVVPSTQGFIDAAKLGLGWGMNPAHLVEPLIRSGELVGLGQNPQFDIPLYWQCNRITAKTLAPLTKAVRNVTKDQKSAASL
ncbi:LysR family transcriptional regulator ArgP [Cochlodiniinecator piscidefendens]|uniref:LysR family transcriptional regulator ArgP n=1 Tax=Cochlodiniinecator piscidefendens TaxID=2715756 RepID=UPI0014079CAD|nr:LysR family transcriptional regulator ArgP [Cochlodiniinecator piscidefendens]